MRLALFLCVAACAYGADDLALRKALTAKTGTVTLPAGEFQISREIILPGDAHDLEIKGSSTTLKASPEFRGRALLVLVNGKNVRIHDLNLDGNRDAVGRMFSLPNAGTMYSRFVPSNGILVENATALQISDIKATKFAGFAVLINSSKGVQLHDIDVTASGSFNAQRRNNGTGGIVMEEGTSGFEIHRCAFGTIRGDGVVIRSSDHGKIFENQFRSIAREAIRTETAKEVHIDNNTIEQVGFPVEEVDGPGALCMRLERFDAGTVTNNTCTEALLGGIYLSGAGNKLTGNHFTGLNAARRDVPGIFLASGAKDNVIDANEISGTSMSMHCVGAAPDVLPASNKVLKNDCSDEASVARLLRFVTPRSPAFATAF
jgi:parallel beta-helix repeat protein